MSLLSSLLSVGKPPKPSGTRSVVSKDLRQSLTTVQASPISRTVKELYSLFLWDYGGSASEGNQSVVVFPEGTGADPAGKRHLAEYYFTVPPKIIEVAEPYATHIQPTQDGGKFIESQGSILKEIRVQGTTGVRPNIHSIDLLGLGAATDALGIKTPRLDKANSVLTKADRLRGLGGLSPSEVTGHDDIIFLRNIFRLYADLKAEGEAGSRVVMIWSNQKDGDYWIVEPKDLRVNQSSASPLSYDYQLTLTTLAKFDQVNGGNFDLISEIRSAKKFVSRIKDLGNELFNSHQVISTNKDKLGGLPIDLDDEILRPSADLINALISAKAASTRAKAIIRERANTLSRNTYRALAAVRAATNANAKAIGVLDPQNAYERSLRRMLQVTSGVLADQSVSKSVYEHAVTKQSSATNAYNKGGLGTSQRLPPNTSIDPTFIGNQVLAAGVAQDVVYAGETIFSVASRLLQDDRLWKSIVVLNQLKSPYVSNTPAEGVLVPGDAVMYPVPLSQGMSSNSISAFQADGEETSESRDSDPLEVAYGRDLRLRTSESGGRDLTDLVVNQRGDIGSIQGIDNVTQGMRLKFATERGELPAQPGYGARYALGSKATPTSLNQFKIDTRATILSDPRVKVINRLDFVVSGDLLGVDADITLVDSTTILQTSFAVRRF